MKMHTQFYSPILKGRKHFEDLCIAGKVMLKPILSRVRKESFGSINAGEFLDSQLFKNLYSIV
jgi:hypothetical protein